MLRSRDRLRRVIGTVCEFMLGGLALVVGVLWFSLLGHILLSGLRVLWPSERVSWLNWKDGCCGGVYEGCGHQVGNDRQESKTLT